jgi:uncharacterized protein (DUF1810 family)
MPASTPVTVTSDPFDLERFVTAQAGVYERALGELQAGQKRSHWMWYIFPQVAGLGFSSMAQRYAIQSREEAQCFLNHPLLGARIAECAQALLSLNGRTAGQILGSPDDLKLRSSMTLFARVGPPGSVFRRVLDKYFNGEEDPKTVEFLDK